MTVEKLDVKACVRSATAYYCEADARYIMKLQLMYDSKYERSRNFQVITFAFLKECELLRAIRSLKAVFDIKNLSDISGREAYISLYSEKGGGELANAEMIAISTNQGGRHAWYPSCAGISSELRDHQTIFVYQ